MNEQEEFLQSNVIRIYNTQVIDRLNDNYKSRRYESKNHYLNELIVAGLERKEYEEKILQNCDLSNTALNENLRGLTERIARLETYTQNQFRRFYAINATNNAVLSSIYFLAEAGNAGYSLSNQDLKSGFYDTLPIRFERIYEDSLKRYDLL